MLKTIAPLKVIVAAALALTAFSAQAQVTSSSKGYLLRMKYTKGATIKYTISSMIGMGTKPNPPVISPMIIKVLSTTKDSATLKMTVGPITNNGHVVKPAQTAETKVDSMGRPSGGPSSMMMGGAYPEKPIKVGQTWTSNVPMAQIGGNATAKFIFRGIKTVNGRRLALIGIGLSSAAAGVSVTGKGEMQALASDGTMYHMNLNVDFVSTNPSQGGKSGAIQSVTTISRK